MEDRAATSWRNAPQSTPAGRLTVTHALSRITFWIVCLLPALGAAPGAHAEIYRSVDENGTVTYSAIKPVGRPADQVRIKVEQSQPGASEALQDMVTAADQARAERLKKAEEQATEEALGKKKEDLCERARDNLERMEQTPRVFHVNDAGDRERVSEEQRQADMARLREVAAKNCN